MVSFTELTDLQLLHCIKAQLLHIAKGSLQEGVVGAASS